MNKFYPGERIKYLSDFNQWLYGQVSAITPNKLYLSLNKDTVIKAISTSVKGWHHLIRSMEDN